MQRDEANDARGAVKPILSGSDRADPARRHTALLEAVNGVDLDIVRTKMQVRSAPAGELEGLLKKAGQLVDHRAAMLAELATLETEIMARRHRELEKLRDDWVNEIERQQAGGYLPTDDEVRA
jgi:hypothetical protein